MGGGGGVPMNSSSLRSDSQRPKRPSATARKTMSRRWGPRQCEADCCFNSCAESGHKDSVRGATAEEQLSSKTIHPAKRAQLHLPPLDLSWALERSGDRV